MRRVGLVFIRVYTETIDTPRKFIPDAKRKPALLIHRFAVPLPRWGRQRNGPTNPNLKNFQTFFQNPVIFPDFWCLI
ncbi:MAG: hypothetical protein IJ363_09840, partial [Clostridia bacterium]|nr:hypothetical protein [Clostridia bacterium]